MKPESTFLLIASLPFVFFMLGYSICILLFDHQTCKAPSLIGQNISQAIKITSALHINLQIAQEKETVGIPAGTILSQKPTAHRLIKTHQSMIVTISKLPEKQKAPDVSTIPLSNYKQLGSKLGITIKKQLIPLESNTDKMLGQFPQAGQIMQNQELIVYKSTSKEPVYIMPSFINQTLSQAQEALTLFQAHYEILPHENKQKNHEYKIVAQKPSAGSLIDRAKTIMQFAID